MKALLRAGMLSILVLSTWTTQSPADANFNRSYSWFTKLSAWERQGIQRNLILTGFYAGFTDGVFGQNTYSAIREFEAAFGFSNDGVLGPLESVRLVSEASRWRDRFRFKDEDDLRTGTRIPIPEGVVAGRTITDNGSKWVGAQDGITIETSLFHLSDVRLEMLFAAMIDPKIGGEVTYRRMNDDFFVVAGRMDQADYYALAKRNGSYISALHVSWPEARDEMGSRLATYLASTVSHTTPIDPPPPSSENRSPELTAAPEPKPTEAPSSGTGFFVSTTGLILTNYHVIDGCSSIDVPGHGTADVMRQDKSLDLAAILVSEPPFSQLTAVLEAAAPGLGSPVTVGGFPLTDLLGNDFTVAFGAVTARKGLGGDPNAFSVSAPIQPGNSGGPVVNSNGKVVGIAFAKLNDAKMMEAAGTTGANFSFAINASLAIKFLRPFSINVRNEYVTGINTPDAYSNERISGNIEAYAVQVKCNRNFQTTGSTQ